jgi:hypothetical protein
MMLRIQGSGDLNINYLNDSSRKDLLDSLLVYLVLLNFLPEFRITLVL